MQVYVVIKICQAVYLRLVNFMLFILFLLQLNLEKNDKTVGTNQTKELLMPDKEVKDTSQSEHLVKWLGSERDFSYIRGFSTMSIELGASEGQNTIGCGSG